MDHVLVAVGMSFGDRIPPLKSVTQSRFDTTGTTHYTHFNLNFCAPEQSVRKTPIERQPLCSSLTRGRLPSLPPSLATDVMAGPKRGDNSKKVAGNARKAEAAAQKAAAENAKKESAEAQKWQTGAKDSSKRYFSPLLHTLAATTPGRLARLADRTPLAAYSTTPLPRHDRPKPPSVRKSSLAGLVVAQPLLTDRRVA